MSNKAFAAFKEKAAASEGLFLKPADIVDTQRFKVIPWLYHGNVTPIHFFYEGWIPTGKTSKGRPENKPIRFEFNEEGGYDAPDDIEWARGDFGVQKPKGCFACVVADMKSDSIRILSGTQKTLLGPLSDMCFDESELRIKDWKAYDILITRDKKTEKFTVTREKLDKEDRDYPQWINDALEDFHFSLEVYMDGDKQEEGEGTTYQDVLDAIGVVPTKEEKTERLERTEKPKSKVDDRFIKDWAETTTPKGVLLGTCTEEKLREMKGVLDGAGKTKSMLYDCICSGIQEFESQKNKESLENQEEIPF